MANLSRILFVSLAVCPGGLSGQQQTQPAPQESKRLLWLIPNYRTAPSITNYHPMTPRQKFLLATTDAFDRGNIAIIGLVAGYGQLTHAEPSFGQGMAGYGHYYGASYASLTTGAYLIQGVYPTLLHQDPRYFRKGSGGWSRVGYAMGQVFRTHSDKGQGQFNYSEMLGVSSTIAISMSYYPDHRAAAYASERFAVHLGLDMASNILKEYWPDIDHKVFKRHERDIP